jgi:hypothetical protein
MAGLLAGKLWPDVLAAKPKNVARRAIRAAA